MKCFSVLNLSHLKIVSFFYIRNAVVPLLEYLRKRVECIDITAVDIRVIFDEIMASFYQALNETNSEKQNDLFSHNPLYKAMAQFNLPMPDKKAPKSAWLKMSDRDVELKNTTSDPQQRTLDQFLISNLPFLTVSVDTIDVGELDIDITESGDEINIEDAGTDWIEQTFEDQPLPTASAASSAAAEISVSEEDMQAFLRSRHAPVNEHIETQPRDPLRQLRYNQLTGMAAKQEDSPDENDESQIPLIILTTTAREITTTTTTPVTTITKTKPQPSKQRTLESLGFTSPRKRKEDDSKKDDDNSSTPSPKRRKL